MVICVVFVFFIYKQKTAYDMRIIDWSADVYSSDLSATPRDLKKFAVLVISRTNSSYVTTISRSGISPFGKKRIAGAVGIWWDRVSIASNMLCGSLHASKCVRSNRSEERRVGKECVSTCRSRWWPYNLKKKK